MYIAKMITRYPEFKGSGYYNFIMDNDIDELQGAIDDNLHDYILDRVVKTRFKSINNIINKYPSKQSLNNKYFK